MIARRLAKALAATALVGVSLSACIGDPGVTTGGTGGGGPGGAGSGGIGPGTGSGGTGPGTGSGGTGPGASGGAPGFTLDCNKPNLGSPVERLLTRAELEATLVDIFPEVKGQWAGSLPANRMGYASGWFIFRERAPWWAILPTACTMPVNIRPPPARNERSRASQLRRARRRGAPTRRDRKAGQGRS